MNDSFHGSTGATDIRARFGRRVVELREARSWTQEELSHRSGISTRSISNIENAVFSATLDTVQRIACGFRIETRDLFDFRQRR